MPPTVSVERVSKLYQLGSIGGHTLQEGLIRWWAAVRGQPDPSVRLAEEGSARQAGTQFWALRDVSFEVAAGQAIAVIGRNGAGKSTILKILSQLTAPTKGIARLRGRVASLLEVGTGFHPDLTGRENVFLNGAIMGMRAHDIRRHFDEIVAFSECEAFIDTPVKRYSSGMYVRLAFAVAAHLDAEILIIDEVLAVGDARFQQKCLGRMAEVTGTGRTVLFVSHNMGAVLKLCQTAVLLEGGRVSLNGSAADAVELYLAGALHGDGTWVRSDPVPEGQAMWIREVRFLNARGEPAPAVPSTTSFTIELVVEVVVDMRPMQLAVRMTNQEGIPVFTTANTDVANELLPLPRGTHRFRVEVPGGILTPGIYSALAVAHIPRQVRFDLVEGLHLRVEHTGPPAIDDRHGVVSMRLGWQPG